MMCAECTTLTVLALVYVEKYWIVKVFANLMNDTHFAKIFPKNACKYGEITTKDLFTAFSFTKCVPIYREKNTLITVIFWTLYVGKNGRVEFWQIAVDKANSEEYFDESDDCSTDPVPY